MTRELTRTELAACEDRLARNLMPTRGQVESLVTQARALLDLREEHEKWKTALRDAEAMDRCEHTSGGDADTYETIKARRLALLTEPKPTTEKGAPQSE
jgi:3-methyladenine DNA glycosylase Tag